MASENKGDQTYEKKAEVLKIKLDATQREISKINSMGREALRDPTKIDLFASMFGTLDKYFDKHESILDSLLELYVIHPFKTQFPTAEEQKRIDDIKRYYHEARVTHKKIEDDNRPAPPAPVPIVFDPNLTINATGSGLNESSRAPNYLPKISIPAFDGNLTAWPKFRDTFVSLVHSDKNNLTDMERFHYLVTSVTGPAASVISHLSLEENNYQLAWKAMLSAFDVKRMLASAYLNQILSFKAHQYKPTVDSLKKFTSTISDNVNAFKLLKIPNPAEYILLHLAERCLDPTTREQFEISSKDLEFPTFDNLSKFVQERCLAMQLAENSTLNSDTPGKTDKLPFKSNRFPNNNQQHSKGASTTLLSSNSSPRFVPDCTICHEGRHPLASCKLFQSTPRAQRINLINNWKGCINCLNHNHVEKDCSSKWKCRFCDERHHSDLHVFENTLPSENRSAATLSAVPSNSPATTQENGKIVILGTVVAEALDARGIFVPIRIVVDSCSHYSYITQRAMFKLGLSHERCTRKIACMGGSIFEGVKGKAACILRPRNLKSPNVKAEVLVVKKIVPFLPSSELPKKLINAFDGFKLADPTFWKPGPIDILLGADLFSSILTGPIVEVGANLPKLFESIFGYIIIGQASTPHSESGTFTGTTLLAVPDEDEDLNKLLEKFWEIEEPKPLRKIVNPVDEECEIHFRNTFYRMEDGRYVVSLPFKNNIRPSFGDTSNIAMRRFYGQERKLQKDSELKQQYVAFMDEYVSLGHMYETNAASEYIIPHHSVTKEDRNKIKLRVVFDASSKNVSGSLNDHLLIGPKLQNDIFEILLNFRAHAIVFVTDITKFYRNILLTPADRPYQHIYWRQNPSSAVKKFELATLTYGLSSSPFLSLRVIDQLREDHGNDYPEAAKILSRDIFIDDIATGAATMKQALDLQHQIISILDKGKFTLSKWASNRPELLESVSENSSSAPITLSDSETPTLKILGLQWESTNDAFLYKIIIPTTKATKRGVLSSIARIFDPLGFLSPVVFTLKVLMQDLWKQRPSLGWDEEIAPNLRDAWISIISELNALSDVRIPRFVYSEEPSQYQILGFADASSKGYCAVIYIRTQTTDGIKVNLLAAKSKVAPVKQVTVPRLELCAAVLLSQLYDSMKPFFQVLPNPPSKVHFFIDASIVLGWLTTPTYQLKTYVANRIELIHELTPGISWNHIPSEQNPGDVGSRGVKPSDMVENSIWWNGPEFIHFPEDKWPQSSLPTVEKLPELKAAKVTLVASTSTKKSPYLVKWMSRFSSWYSLLRVVATLRRGIYNYRNRNSPKIGNLEPIDIEGALLCCVEALQRHYFFNGDPNNTKGFMKTYKNLLPFRDENSIWRVGGRLRKSELPYDQKHPLLLPYEAHFTTLLVDYYHRTYAHAGPTFTQSIIQKRFWVTGLRRLVRKRYFRCLLCFKDNADSIIPVMADLPSFRVQGKCCFRFTGTDFAGPFLMRESLRRKAQVSKVYMCLFVCMETKALHIEAVTSLSTDAFLAAFDRFCSRRGLPSEMFSDCGKNFVGAANTLKELAHWFRNAKPNIVRHSTEKGIKWNFNPPYGAHHGGLWEAGVRSVKTLMRKSVGETPLSYEELSTAFAKFESILNSRPLCPLSNDPENLDFLTPGHFLVGGHLLAHPEPSLLDLQENRLDRWQLVRKIHQQFWSRWRLEYLNTLQKRNKWTEAAPNLKEGDLVLLKDPSSPSLRWPLARVTLVHPGDDGNVRVVTLRTANSTFTRPVTQIVPLLPLNDPDPREI